MAVYSSISEVHFLPQSHTQGNESERSGNMIKSGSLAVTGVMSYAGVELVQTFRIEFFSNRSSIKYRIDFPDCLISLVSHDSAPSLISRQKIIDALCTFCGASFIYWKIIIIEFNFLIKIIIMNSHDDDLFAVFSTSCLRKN